MKRFSLYHIISHYYIYNSTYTDLTFSLIISALLQSGSASWYLPRLLNSTERLFSVAATWQYNSSGSNT